MVDSFEGWRIDMIGNTVLHSRINRKNRSTLVANLLSTQLANTQMILSHIENARGALERITHPKVISLLDHIKSELHARKEYLESQYGWSFEVRVPPLDKSDYDPRSRLYSTQLEVLHGECARYLRSTGVIIKSLKTLGESKALEIVEEMRSIAEHGMCLTDVYINGLAIRMDPGHLPDWPEDRKVQLVSVA